MFRKVPVVIDLRFFRGVRQLGPLGPQRPRPSKGNEEHIPGRPDFDAKFGATPESQVPERRHRRLERASGPESLDSEPGRPDFDAISDNERWRPRYAGQDRQKWEQRQRISEWDSEPERTQKGPRPGRAFDASKPQTVNWERRPRTISEGSTARRRGEPVTWLRDSTTYADAHSVVLDPHSSLPYPTEDVKDLMQRNEHQLRALASKRSRSEQYFHRVPGALNFDHIPIEQQVVVLFPGQGAQHVGMASNIADCPPALRLFEEASEVLGYDLKKLCNEGPKTKLDQTVYCQPALFVSSLSAFERVKAADSELVGRLTCTAGFSVGELASLVIAKTMSFADALRFVKRRAELMHECNQKIAAGMVTVKVNAASQLSEALFEARQAAREKHELAVCDVANLLYCGVKVIGGTETCLKFLTENQDRFHLKVVKRLEVSGAFHTPLMEGAVEPLREAINEVQLSPPVINVYSNFTGTAYERSLKSIRRNVALQVCSPVKWEQILQLLFRKSQNDVFPTYMEVGPGRQIGAMIYQTSKKMHKSYESHTA